MELNITAPAEGQAIQPVEFNYEEMKTYLTNALVNYKGLVYSEENIKEAKSDRSKLNKLKEALETRRKEIKKLYLEPYERFESQIKELAGMVDAPAQEIDQQVKAFEQKKKAAKLNEIEEYFNDNVGDLTKLLRFERIMNPKWLNSSTTMSSIKKEIDTLIFKVNNELDLIRVESDEYLLPMQDRYIETLDIGEALKVKAQLEERAKRLAEREEERKQREAAMASAKAAQAQPPKESVAPVPAATKPEAKPQPVQLDFRVWVTGEQMEALKQFLVTNNIKYGRVE